MPLTTEQREKIQDVVFGMAYSELVTVPIDSFVELGGKPKFLEIPLRTALLKELTNFWRGSDVHLEVPDEEKPVLLKILQQADVMGLQAELLQEKSETLDGIVQLIISALYPPENSD